MDIRIEYFIIPVAILVATFVLGAIVNRILIRVIKRATADMKNDPTSYKFMRHVIRATIYVVGFGLAIYSVPSLKAFAGSVLAGAGILAVAVGFASQQALSNLISGVFIIVFKPFRINDRLTLRTFNGFVEDITLRHTVIRDFESKRIIIPNSLISEEILINSDFANEKICKWIDVTISYESDLDLAKSIIADEIIKHPLHVDPRTPEQLELGIPEAIVRVLQLQDSGVLLRGWSWASNAAESFVLGCDLLESIKKRFDREGITIPYPQRTLHFKNEDKILESDNSN